MANLTKVAVSIVSPAPPPTTRLTGLVAGEVIALGDLIYTKSDGTVWRSNGTAATAPAKCRGIALAAAAVGEPITIGRGLLVAYGTGFTPGADLYVSATAGAISDAATTGGTAPIGWVFNSTTLFIHGSAY